MSSLAPFPVGTPRVVLLLKVDTLGDLILFAPVLRSLSEAWPQTRLVVVIRQAYLDLAPFLVPRVEWLATTLDPFANGPDHAPAELDRLRTTVAAVRADVIAAATSRRNWLDVVLAATTPTARRLALGAAEEDEFFATQLRVQLGLRTAEVFAENIAPVASEPDWRRNFALADALLGRSVERVAPTFRSNATSLGQVASFLDENQLVAGGYLVCAAAGFANVKLKTWPADRFGLALKHFHQRHGLPILLVGHETERTHLEEVRSHAGKTPVTLWLGREGELPQLAALISQSALFFGNDTGAMHLAAALDVPIVTIFGGGTWPRFSPAARRGIALVQPLPCFGCGWDCVFGDAPCLGGITVDDACVALDFVFLNRGKNSFEVRELTRFTPDMLAVMGQASTTYRALRAGHLARQRKFEELTQLDREKDDAILEKETSIAEKEASIAEKEASIAEKEASIAEKEASIAEKEASIHEKEASIHEKEASIHEKEASIHEKEASIHEKEASIAEKEASIHEKEASIHEKEASIHEKEASIHEKEASIAEKEASIAEKETEIDALKAVCDEREKTIFILDGHVREIRALLESARADKAQFEAIFASLPPDAAGSARALADQSVHIRNVESLVILRDREIVALKLTVAERDQSLAHYVAGLSGLEQAKHYGRLLAEKEAVLQMLNRACIEREVVIKQLAAETTGLGAALRKFWLAAVAGLREKIWRPCDTWLFKKTVEQYWMQIGILQHYAPRPLLWDQRLPGSGLSASRLPQIALVTPSYGQEKFIERTMLSVHGQAYPKLLYAVQDGGSRDRSAEIIARHASHLRHWESVPDAGQADAIRRGFAHLTPSLGPDDVMAWLNSDDLIGPGVLAFVAAYFTRHPEVDVIYGHRIIIDDDDRDIGRWIMPRHDPHVLEWIDYVPQETLFWRKRAWDLAGGIDPTFQFALDWDLLARFQRAGCRIVRVPYFLGAFRVHAGQKTNHAIHTIGADEMRRIRTRFHGERQDDFQTIDRYARRTRFRGAVVARLMAAGIRW